MIKELMDKLHTGDSEEKGQISKEIPMENKPTVPNVQQKTKVTVPTVPQVPRPSVPKVPVVPQAKTQENLGNGFSLSKTSRNNFGGSQMNTEGIVIDLGEGISLNVPIKKRMTLHDFLKVAEKVKALEMLAEEEAYKRSY